MIAKTPAEMAHEFLSNVAEGVEPQEQAAAPIVNEAPKLGRPSTFSQALADEICERIAIGETLTDICDEDGMPDRRTVIRWKNANEAFCLAYVRAREDQAHSWADEIVSISDDGSRDYTKTEDGREIVDHDHIQRAKLRVDTRKFLMARLAPRAYGERVALEHTGKDGAPIETQDVTDRELAKRTAYVLRRAQPGGQSGAKETRH